ncbi:MULTISPECIES: DUF3024 domain-containing protein [unclassified Lentimonas]|uniref:DUF3024 domain-containing protein n=1 Tax=unclassified Lentimonas TaxID=2630993 RepID=UPI001321D2D9|nr:MULTISPECIES: DUF3024 domain-containing protein [unclassified Lentimonas]CAA6679702.1 Unannotated [Lentimonas sp. CC4]CAA6683532.1 Unannotated [Lentimonas sp. CC6]CAA6690803.1 Unannotated [Lentimonas sp. CC19]CAA6693280.1 Unannotated [Lentimonas sp. CC10]CAA7071775.1 Unannotated [Lentimonas sp. CC11]
MPFTEFEDASIRAAMDAFIERRRPEPSIRAEVDLAYRIEGFSVVIHEIRPSYADRSVMSEPMVAKATYVRTKNHWKVLWQRASLKWQSYDPEPTVKHIDGFIKLVDEDAYACFWG